ncbi:hypothetical protein Cni_G12942 [Canna indica]|uniref:Uncharacterized protein n=1 Tax=Canna indica TaxID=4628 RepID=A0AAQ3Q9G5_9LILI|nr:hypothetical protein Cni_G12942 [Canna indica]
MNLFGGIQLSNICGIYIPKHEAMDRWIWNKNDTGTLSCKSAYNFIKEKQGNSAPLGMNCIPKIKTFAWKLIWKRIPTSSYFAKFNGGDINKCPVCMNGEDSQNHLFFYCSFAISYWNTVENVFGINFEQFSEWKEGNWMLEGKKYGKEDGNKLNGFIGDSLWHLWKNRNRVFFDKKRFGVNTILSKAFADVSSPPKWVSDKEDKTVRMHGDLVSVFPIDKEQVGIYCDAAWFNNLENAGLGVLIKNHEGKSIAEFSSSKILSSALNAELWAIWKGLLLAKDLNIEGAAVYSDCQTAIKILKRLLNDPWFLNELVNGIWRIAELMGIKDWYHLRREKNKPADSLAKLGMQGVEFLNVFLQIIV